MKPSTLELCTKALEHANVDLEHFWYKWKAGVRPSELRAQIKDALADLQRTSERAAVDANRLLLPCPFCGSKPETEQDGLGGSAIWCDNDDCPVQVEYSHHVGKEDAIEAWNKRVAPHATAQVFAAEWQDAPEWANYLAMDASGGTFWYERKPEMYRNEGWINGGRTKLAKMAGEGWRATLQQRPPSAASQE